MYMVDTSVVDIHLSQGRFLFPIYLLLYVRSVVATLFIMHNWLNLLFSSDGTFVEGEFLLRKSEITLL